MVEPGKQPQLYQPNTGRNVAELHSNFEPQSAQPRFSSPESRPNLEILLILESSQRVHCDFAE